LKMRMQVLSIQQIEQAAEWLRSGEIVAFPTETVYGLGAPIFNETAIQTLFSVKRRPSDNPLIAHISSIDDLEKLVKKIPKEAFLLAEAFWPGPLSLLFEARDEVPLIARGGLSTIAVRMPAHNAALALIQAVGQPLVAPSANLSGRPSSTTVEHVRQDFEHAIIAAVDGGPCSNGIESTVLDLCLSQTPRILRPGSISAAMIEQVIQKPVYYGESEKPLCPGMKYRHYAPETPIRLFYHRSAMEEYLGILPLQKRMILTNENQTLSAETFYASLRRADEDQFEEIVILCDNFTILNEALYHRIIKAAGQHVGSTPITTSESLQ
jgi:L-threonylcarbamoyladenylate synthase